MYLKIPGPIAWGVIGLELVLLWLIMPGIATGIWGQN
jgi:hypothetical protein